MSIKRCFTEGSSLASGLNLVRYAANPGWLNTLFRHGGCDVGACGGDPSRCGDTALPDTVGVSGLFSEAVCHRPI